MSNPKKNPSKYNNTLHFPIKPFACLDSNCRASFTSWHKLSTHIQQEHRDLLHLIPELHGLVAGPGSSMNATATATAQLIHEFNNTAEQCFSSNDRQVDMQSLHEDNSSSLQRNRELEQHHRDRMSRYTKEVEPWSVMKMRSQRRISSMDYHKQPRTSRHSDGFSMSYLTQETSLDRQVSMTAERSLT